MTRQTRFLVTWVDSVSLLAAARNAGWKDGDGGALDYASEENHLRCRDFVRQADALKHARLRLSVDFFGQVEVEEQQLEIEPMDDGGPPLRSWETIRRCSVEDDGCEPQWESVR
jgi:hypothetical protein